nr:uncharacterized protein LOC106682249 isoform X2 [Halyomorpha halys]
MILFTEYLVGNFDQPNMDVTTNDTAELLEDPEAYMPGEEPAVVYQKSKVIFFAYFIPIIFLILGIIVFMGAVIQKFKKNDEDQMNFKNYGTCHSENMRLFQHCPPSTSRSRSLNDGDKNATETLNKELEKRLDGDSTEVLPSKSKKGKKNKKLNFVHIP